MERQILKAMTDGSILKSTIALIVRRDPASILTVVPVKAQVLQPF